VVSLRSSGPDDIRFLSRTTNYCERLLSQSNVARTLSGKFWVVQPELRHETNACLPALCRSHVPDLYLEYNTLPVTLLREQQLPILAHKIIHHPESVPELFIDYLNRSESVRTDNTKAKMIYISLGSILIMELNVQNIEFPNFGMNYLQT